LHGTDGKLRAIGNWPQDKAAANARIAHNAPFTNLNIEGNLIFLCRRQLRRGEKHTETTRNLDGRQKLRRQTACEPHDEPQLF
jgi:hypothetical protein